jgi:hypothetical protein
MILDQNSKPGAIYSISISGYQSLHVTSTSSVLYRYVTVLSPIAVLVPDLNPNNPVCVITILKLMVGGELLRNPLASFEDTRESRGKCVGNARESNHQSELNYLERRRGI